MKPSEKIKEIYHLLGQPTDGLDAVVKQIVAIQAYLDEEYERNKPCKCVTKGDTITNANCQVHYK